MFTKLLPTLAGVLIVASAAVAQKSGSVVRVDSKQQQIEVKIGEMSHVCATKDVELLDKEGKAAKLENFAAGDQVKITLDGDRITKIQQAAAKREVAVAKAPAEGSIVRIDNEQQRIELKVGDKVHVVAASAVTLVDKEGKPAKLADFAAGDKVTVTMDGDKVSKIQKA